MTHPDLANLLGVLLFVGVFAASIALGLLMQESPAEKFSNSLIERK